MSLPVILHEAAELEAVEAITWYENEAGLGAAIREEIEATIERIIATPLAFPVIYGSAIRSSQTHRFPYSVIFTIDENQIFVVAIFHTSCNPLIWKGRID